MKNMISHPLISVFKAYDIRGRAPEELNEAFARKLGAILAEIERPKRVLVGRDMRETSPELEKALIRGLTEAGVSVTTIGLCSTPMFNILIGLSNGSVDLGVMVTASHNPGIYNGFKLTRGDCSPIGIGSGMEKIRDAFLSQTGNVSSAGTKEKKETGSVEVWEGALEKYVDHVMALAAIPKDIPKVKVVIDAGNGMAGAVLPTLLKRCPWLEVVEMYFTPDGRFPNHEANPLKAETVEELRKRVVQEGAVLGIAFDGDADRVGFIDEKGIRIPGDIQTAIFAEILLRRYPNSRILYDVRGSWSIPKTVERAGGYAEMCKVGHANIKRAMREKGAVFAGELSMHYYFKELWNVESGDYGLLLFLKELTEQHKIASQIRTEHTAFYHSEEINFSVKDKEAVLRALKERYASEATRIIEIDGIRMEFGGPEDPDSWWFSVRASNTEPLVRLNVEAVTEPRMTQKISELSAQIK